MEKILITGSSGFIGSHLSKRLSENNYIIGIDILSTSNIASLKRSLIFNSSIQESIHNSFIDNLQDKPTIVIHLAAETGIAESLTNPDLYFNQNVKGTFNVLEQCRKNGVKYLIYASSSSVYEPNLSQMNEESPHHQQLSFYGTSKKMTETMVQNYCSQYGMIAIGLRFFTVYGSWTRPDMAAYKFMNAINNDQSIFLYNDGNVYRDFTHVNDIVHSISLLTERIKQEKDGSHRIFNIGFGTPISIKEYAEEIAKNLNKKILFMSKDLPKNELERTHCDNSKLEKYINFKPKCSIEEGIVEMTDWFKKFKYE